MGKKLKDLWFLQPSSLHKIPHLLSDLWLASFITHQNSNSWYGSQEMPGICRMTLAQTRCSLRYTCAYDFWIICSNRLPVSIFFFTKIFMTRACEWSIYSSAQFETLAEGQGDIKRTGNKRGVKKMDFAF